MGNYIGTQPDGVTANRNGTDNVNSSVAISIGDWSQIPNTDFSTTGTKIGSTNPADRNVISGNYGGAIGIIGVNTTVLGNYLGVGSDGVTALGNAQGTGVTTGGMTIDYAHSVTIGGDAVGSANVISSNKNGGIHPDYSSDINVIGNFLGTDYSGTLDRGNGYSGVSFAQVDASGTVGQYTSTVRNNIIKFNDSYGVATNDYQMDNIVISSNTVSESQTGIDINSDGGVVTAFDNTISSSTQNGIYIGGTGNTISDNTISDSTQNGISVSATDNTITGNIISDSTQHGLALNSGATNNEVSSNTISTSTQNGISVSATDNIIAGNTAINNTGVGISIEASDNQILDNIISNNHGPANLMLNGTGSGSIQNLTVQGNKIGTRADGTIDGSYTQGAGILIFGNVTNSLIGGTNPGEGNIIAGNNGVGIANSGLNITGFGILSPTSNSILSNSIFGNDAGNLYGFAVPGLGIDNYMVNLDGSFVPQSTSEDGPTPNDSTDADTGPNNYMNFPVLNSATQNDNQLTVDLNLDAADTTDAGGNYRVEFFANDTADPSGYGEGQTYLGSANIANGNNQTANITLPANTNLTGKVLSATTTAMNNATPSGFGSTSEFSEVLSNITVNITQASTGNETNNQSSNNQANSNLANTGERLTLFAIAIGSLLIITSIAGVYLVKRSKKLIV